VKNLENLKNDGRLPETQDLDNLSEEIQKELKNESNEQFKKRLDSLHDLMENVTKDLEDVEISEIDRSKVLHSIYDEFEKKYLESQDKI